MPIVLVRVDDRLIHGQILEGWLPSTRAEEVLVANDALAFDQTQKMIMESAVPGSIRLIVDSVERIALLLLESGERDLRRMVIVDSPMDALRLKRAGVQFDHLNLGNLGTNKVRTYLSRTVVVGDDGMQALFNIVDEGVQDHIQSVPFDKPVDLSELCGCLPKA